MKLIDIAMMARNLPDCDAFQWPGPEHFHDDVFAKEMKSQEDIIEYITELRKRMSSYSMALEELGAAYRELRDMLLEAEIASPSSLGRTLESLLKMQVFVEKPTMPGVPIATTPHFRVSVQGPRDGGTHFIIHADGYNSDTLDFVAKGNTITPV